MVERFARESVSYQSGSYNETQTRREFIDPLFKALGWDIDNEAGFAEAYKDVVHEDAIKVGGFTKAPDYCFRVGGTRKFFVEAKKPSVNIRDDVGPAFQLRRYAWSAKLPLSILTDFEELAVYDCRVRPEKTDGTGIARTMYFSYDRYEEHWDEIAGIFSKEAILHGSFDRYADSTKAKRGTAEVDAAFLTDIDAWREVLARNVALRNPSLTQRELNYSVQTTIDRVIFLRICEDRGIEDYGQLQALCNGVNTYGRLLEIFHSADQRYNSGLFHFEKEKGRGAATDTLTPRLGIDDKPLKDIVRRLYYPDSPYEFSVLPANILGQVYEQFLGKVIRLTSGHRAVVEDKPEVKKAGGVYYTPTYIVDYIVKNTVGKLLEGSNPKRASELRILDPACGSGSFLIGAFQHLLDWHRDWYVENDPTKHTKEVFVAAGGDYRLTTAEKKRILLNNIYGVDIDSQAVETTKLSLLLKVLEGETQETINAQLSFLRERALPDLGSNIECGNSLIGPDFYEGLQMGLLDDEERYRINVFDWEAEFPHILGKGVPEIRRGFDAVIGNPPYGATIDALSKEYFGTHYSYQSYQLDSYLLFLERAVMVLLGGEGRYGMIIPNPWLTNLRQTGPRRLVTGKTQIEEIVHFRFPVFRGITVDTEIVLLRMGSGTGHHVRVKVVASRADAESEAGQVNPLTMEHSQDRWNGLDGAPINIFMSEAEAQLASKIASAGVRAGDLMQISVGIKPYQVGKGTPPQTRQTVDTRPFDSVSRTTDHHRVCLRGGDIGRYRTNMVEPRYLKYGPWLAEPRPSVDFDAPEKIVMRQTGDSIVATVDRNRCLCMNNMHVLLPRETSPSLEYCLGVLNSKLMNWYYRSLNPEAGEALAEVKKSHVACLPIRLCDVKTGAEKRLYGLMVELVKTMVCLNVTRKESSSAADRQLADRDIGMVDKRIDKLVYDLYGLTSDEIEVVETAMAG